MRYEHLLIFSAVCVAAWLGATYLYPSLMLSAYKRAILKQGVDSGPIPINTLYTNPSNCSSTRSHSCRREAPTC